MINKDVSHEYWHILKPGERVLELPNGTRYFVLPSGVYTSKEVSKREPERR